MFLTCTSISLCVCVCVCVCACVRACVRARARARVRASKQAEECSDWLAVESLVLIRLTNYLTHFDNLTFPLK